MSASENSTVYELIIHDPALSNENHSEDFMIGLFRTRSKAEQTAAFYLQNIRGFCEYPCTYSILEKSIVGEQDGEPDEVFLVQGWDTDENLDEINLIDSPCFTSEAQANVELERLKSAQPRAEWVINRWKIDQAHWQEGFERVE